MVRPLLHRLLAWRLLLVERLRPGEVQVTLFWAGLVGCLGGLSAPAFRFVTHYVQLWMTGHGDVLSEAARSLERWQLPLIPAVGGLLAGLVLHFGLRSLRKTSPEERDDYMESVTLGDGVIAPPPALVRIASSVFSIASGGSIGREGAMVQLSALMASAVGRFASFPKPRLRLMVACGAAAGIASAYNAPIGGALFVAEVVLGSIAMESFGPLILASVMGTISAQRILGSEPFFEIPPFHLVSSWELLPYLVLGLISGAGATGFLWFLNRSREVFAVWSVPIYVKLAVGGLIVGILALLVPEVWGNGYPAVNAILRLDVTWPYLVLILIGKTLATGSTVGSGAVGGVFTTTLLIGGVVGSLVGLPVHANWPQSTGTTHAYALVGMGCFLAATTHAPLTAILIVFEMTLDYEIVLPLMLACVTAYTTATALRAKSIYSSSLSPRRAAGAPVHVGSLRVSDLMKPDPISVSDKASFADVVLTFVKNHHNNLYVVGDELEFRGVIPLHEIKPYLSDPGIGALVIAQDIMREDFPTLAPESSLRDALELFAAHRIERIPVVLSGENRRLVGSISKTDLLLTFAHDTTRSGRRTAVLSATAKVTDQAKAPGAP